MQLVAHCKLVAHCNVHTGQRCVVVEQFTEDDGDGVVVQQSVKHKSGAQNQNRESIAKASHHKNTLAHQPIVISRKWYIYRMTN